MRPQSTNLPNCRHYAQTELVIDARRGMNQIQSPDIKDNIHDDPQKLCR